MAKKLETLVCDNCGKAVQKWAGHRKKFKHAFCSRKCSIEHRVRTKQFLYAGKLGVKARQANLTGSVENCAECGAEIYRSRYLVKQFKNGYCSQKCCLAHRIREQRKKAALHVETCKTCKTVFQRQPSRAKYNNGNHYCSKECRNQDNRREKHSNWKGGRQNRSSDGYVDISASLVPEAFKSMARKDGRVMEHRLMMAQHLGRPLEKWEVVNHENGIRNDNRIDNFQLFPKPVHDGVTSYETSRIRELKEQIKSLQSELTTLQKKGE